MTNVTNAVSRATRHVSLTVALYQPTCSNWTL